MRTKDTILLEEAYTLVVNETSKGHKPDWLLAAQLKAEGKKGKKGNGNTKCPKCGCNPDKPKAGCKCKHKNKKMMKEGHEEGMSPTTDVHSTGQTAFGLFSCQDYEGNDLLGLYSSQQEAEQARRGYIEGPAGEGEGEDFGEHIKIVQLKFNQSADLFFVKV